MVRLRHKLIGILVGAMFAANTACAEPITVPTEWLYLPEHQVTCEDRGGTLLLSDCPEMAPSTGILYRDTVEGKVRLFLYHVNDTKRPKRIAALITNETDAPQEIRVTRWADSEPGYDWVAVGRDTQLTYMKEERTDRLHLAPHETRVLTRTLEDKWIRPQQLVHTIHDFETDGAVTVTVLMAPLSGSLADFARTAEVLPPDSSHLRGTFVGMDRYLTAQPYDADKGARLITIGDNSKDIFLRGIDATDGSPAENYGNYGVVYHVDIPIAGGKANAYFAPQGGLYAGGVVLTGSFGQERCRRMPDNKEGYFGVDTITDAAKLGRFHKRIKLYFSPPGASNLPVKLLLIPEE